MRYAMIGILLVLCGSSTFADEITDLRAELATAKQQNEQLKTDIVELEKERAGLLQRVVALTDTVNQSTLKLSQAQDRLRQLMLTKPEHKVKPDADNALRESIDGVVTAVSNNARIEISIGADDGLKLGAKVALKRDGQQIGTAKISKITGDRSVCDVIGKPDRPIRKGDRIDLRIEDVKLKEKLPDLLEGK